MPRATCITAFAASVVLLAPTASADGYSLRWDARPGACRTSNGGSGTFTSYTGLSLGQCKERCYGRNSPTCNAVEYNTRTRGCEVHTREITSSNGNTSSGTTCHKVVDIIWG